MVPDLYENSGKVILDTIYWFYRQNSRVTIYKLLQKNHSAHMAWISRYLNTESLSLQIVFFH